MACEHCGFACTSIGENMNIKTFRKALQWDSEIVTLGGGEPTIHPLFWQILGESLSVSDYVWLATNGKKTEIALTLAKLAKRGVLACALSLDSYHDPIEPTVIQAFTKEKKRDGVGGYYNQDKDFREIRNVTGLEKNAGRCDFGEDACICADVFCKPNGDVFACGCENAPLFGNVHTDIVYPDNWEIGECWKTQNKN